MEGRERESLSPGDYQVDVLECRLVKVGFGAVIHHLLISTADCFMHFFLSPHFDDAALSCGGQIAQLTQRGEKVVVFTVMAGDPPVEFQHTPFTQELHKRWGLGNSPIEGRRLEDTIALRSLGADVKFGPYPDAVYRVDGQGQPLYPESTSIFGPVHPDDPVRGAKRA